MRFTRAAKVAAFPLTALILVALVACQGPIGPAGVAGDKGDPGAMGTPGDPGQPAPRNMPPALKAGKVLGTQHFAMDSANPDGSTADGGNKLVGSLLVSDYFEDPEGVADLIFSLAKLSDDDEKIVRVYLTKMSPDIMDNTMAFTENNAPMHMETVTGPAYLTIQAEAKGTVTLNLMVKDGLPDGEATQQITVMVRASNAKPTKALQSVLTAAYAAMSRIGLNRIASTGDVTVEMPDGIFFDADGDSLTVTAAVGGVDTDAIAANKAILGVSIDANGDLLLTPKTGSANVDIPVILTATDLYGKTEVTAMGTEGIQVHVNTAPTLETYAAVGDIPAGSGKMVGDKKALADIVDKSFSVASDKEPNDLVVLADYFEDPDTPEDPIIGDDGICDFVTVPADQKYATMGFNEARANVQVTPLKRGTFEVVVTCTDGKMESVTDRVEVTIRN